MTPRSSYLTHWYYHAPDLMLAALIWLLIARLLLSLIPGASDSANAAVRLLGTLTDPAIKGAGAITPRLVPPRLVIVFAIAWLLAARIGLFMAVSATGARLSMG
jgi:hypothetical protein